MGSYNNKDNQMETGIPSYPVGLPLRNLLWYDQGNELRAYVQEDLSKCS